MIRRPPRSTRTAFPTRRSSDLFFERYDEGSLLSAKGIAEGVENSNYLIDTTRGRYIPTLYEKRVREEDLPFFMALTEHVATKGLPVPGPIHDREGNVLQTLEGRPACLIEFLNRKSVGLGKKV